MDRIDFSNSIDNLCTDDVIKAFDDIMVLYNIVGNYDNIKISKSSVEVASFDVTFESSGMRDSAMACNGCKIDVYGQSVIIDCTSVEDFNLHIIFIRSKED